MVVLCNGMIRSGSTWSFNIALRLLRLCDPTRETLGVYDETPGVLISAVTPGSSPLVVKSHTLDPSVHQLCRTGAIRTIYTWRNPYDVVASSVNMFGMSVEHWLGGLQNALRTWSFHRETNSACIISYETIVTQPSAGITSIASYLGLPIDSQRVSQIAEEFSLENLRRFSQQIDQLGTQRLVQKDGALFDRETLLHQGHIQNGGMGYGAESLNDVQLSAIDAMLREEGFAFLCKPHSSSKRK